MKYHCICFAVETIICKLWISKERIRLHTRRTSNSCKELHGCFWKLQLQVQFRRLLHSGKNTCFVKQNVHKANKTRGSGPYRKILHDDLPKGESLVQPHYCQIVWTVSWPLPDCVVTMSSPIKSLDLWETIWCQVKLWLRHDQDNSLDLDINSIWSYLLFDFVWWQDLSP